MAKKKTKNRSRPSTQARRAERERAEREFERLSREMNADWFLATHDRLERRHRAALAERGVCVPLETTRRENQIDARALVRSATGPDADQATVAATADAIKRDLGCDPYYEPAPSPDATAEREANAARYVTPCFRSGVIRVSDLHDLHFEVLDAGDAFVRLRLQEFTAVLRDGERVAPNALVYVTLSVVDDGTDVRVTRRINLDESMSTPELYEVVPAAEVAPDPVDRLIWRRQAVECARRQLDGQPREKFLDGIVDEYLFVILRVNFMLRRVSASRPKPRAAGGEDEPAAAPDVERVVAPLDAPDPDTRRVRYVGPVRVLSERPPRPVTRRTVTTYHAASWWVRGHVRHYKSGRTAYVHPHVKTRRGMSSDGAGPAPVDIRVRPPLDPTTPAADDRDTQTRKGDQP